MKISRLSTVWLPLLLLGQAVAPATRAQEGVVDFQSDRWQLQNATVGTHLGRTALCGSALLPDADFGDGIIEFDISMTGERSYPGIVFRRQSDQDYERFYIRPHRTTGLYQDALQYTPVIKGIAGWQLYSGEGFTAAAEMPCGEWIHVRLEVRGTQARVFIGEAPGPALVINELKHGRIRGAVGLMGENNPKAHFANFSYREETSLAFDPPPRFTTPRGTITSWELSRSFPLRLVDLERAPAAQGLTELDWRPVESDARGLVDVAWETGRSDPAGDCVFARTTLVAEATRVMPLRFGYSDGVSLFLNGRLIFFGNSAYRQRSPSFQGIIGLNDTVYLPLEEGDNELLLAVAESFGGWGFMGCDGGAVHQHPRLTREWELPRALSFPESVVYDRKRAVLYVSNFFAGGREYISRVTPEGELAELEWVGGLSRPTGLCLFRDRLWAVERTGLVEIDPDSGEIAARYPVPGAGFLNDLAFDEEGRAYVSDSQANVIHRLSGGEVTVWLEHEDIGDPNGLAVDRGRLIVGNSADGSLKSVSLADRTVDTLVTLGSGAIMDGLEADGEGNYVFSDFNGRLYHLSAAGMLTELLDTATPPYRVADLEYLPEDGRIFIPTLEGNQLFMYRLKKE